MRKRIVIPTPIGPLAAPPGMSEKIHQMTDAEFCAEMNGRPFVDPFIFGAWMQGYRRDRIISTDNYRTFIVKPEA